MNGKGRGKGKGKGRKDNLCFTLLLGPAMKGFPFEFGIGARGPECFYDGATRWSKKFSDRFSRFDTIPAVTDSQPASNPDSQPPRHVAVASTRYAYLHRA